MYYEQAQIKNNLILIYALYGLGVIFGGLPTIVGLVIAYIKRSDAFGTWQESHFNWLIRTFWISLLFYIIGFVLLLIYIGAIVIFFTTIWMIYRLVKGWFALNSNRAIF